MTTSFIHCVSYPSVATLHCLIIIPLALSVYDSPKLRHDPVLGYDKQVGDVLAVAAG